ncbi:MFS transporter [Paenibacillus jiagnxiensis]|uniref:MFS transporter n=1 Tax=Paenibacillus jiagnxiensis TaxID=3228926 RepID=UPI0033A3EB68
MERLWTKSFVLMTIGMLFLFIAFYSLLPTLPQFIKKIGGNESQVGLATGVFMLSAVIFRPVVGGLLDRVGRRPFMIWGLLIFAVAMYMYDWVGGIIVLLGLRILHGMSWAFSTTAMITAATDMIPAARRGEGMGWFGMAMTLAMAIGPMYGLWVAENLSYHTLFLLAVGLTAVSLLLTLGAKMPFQPQTGTRKIELFERSVLSITIAVFFLSIAYGGITAFVALFANSIGVNSGVFFLVYAATLVLIRPLAGKLADRHGESYVIVPSLVIAVAALLVLSLATGLAGVLVSAVLYGIGFGSAQPALQAATINLARPDRKGVANASLLTATDLGIGLGAIILGWVSELAGYQAMFIACALSSGICFLLFVIFVKRLLKNKAEQNREQLAQGSSS